jgi:hypothetical protein
MTRAIGGVILISVILGMPILGLLVGLRGWPKMLYLLCPLPSAGIAVLSLEAAATKFFAWIYGAFAALTVILELTGYIVGKHRVAPR